VRALLDTCVLSELQRTRPNPAVGAIVDSFDESDVFVSVLSVGELAKGVALLPPSRKRRELAAWIAVLEREYAERVLGIDRDTAVIWGEVTARGRRTGTPIPVVDALVAATALRHGLHVVTRNTRHFQVSGVLLIDPWQTTP
jgi:toxin FitB